MNGNNTPLPHRERKKPSETPQGVSDGFLAPFSVAVEPTLLTMALTHRSWSFEHENAPDNERLEFLGDSVLGLAVTAKLYEEYPELPEGELARRRASLVSAVALAEIARGISLGAELRLGRGEEKSGGREKESILADTVEALIGAVYLSEGPEVAHRFVLQLIEPLWEHLEDFALALDPKTSLQEEATARGLDHPTYEVIGTGPNHDRRYEAAVAVAGVTGRGAGRSKKLAEAAAAKHAVEQLRER